MFQSFIFNKDKIFSKNQKKITTLKEINIYPIKYGQKISV